MSLFLSLSLSVCVICCDDLLMNQSIVQWFLLQRRKEQKNKDTRKRGRNREKVRREKERRWTQIAQLLVTQLLWPFNVLELNFFTLKDRHILYPNYIYDVWWFNSSFPLNIETIIEFQSSILHLPLLNYTTLMILTFHFTSQLCVRF